MDKETEVHAEAACRSSTLEVAAMLSEVEKALYLFNSGFRHIQKWTQNGYLADKHDTVHCELFIPVALFEGHFPTARNRGRGWASSYFSDASQASPVCLVRFAGTTSLYNPMP
eukprot:3053158-Rhodomonas_salina.3